MACFNQAKSPQHTIDKMLNLHLLHVLASHSKIRMWLASHSKIRMWLASHSKIRMWFKTSSVRHFVPSNILLCSSKHFTIWGFCKIHNNSHKFDLKNNDNEVIYCTAFFVIKSSIQNFNKSKSFYSCSTKRKCSWKLNFACLQNGHEIHTINNRVFW